MTTTITRIASTKIDSEGYYIPLVVSFIQQNENKLIALSDLSTDHPLRKLLDRQFYKLDQFESYCLSNVNFITDVQRRSIYFPRKLKDANLSNDDLKELVFLFQHYTSVLDYKQTFDDWMSTQDMNDPNLQSNTAKFEKKYKPIIPSNFCFLGLSPCKQNCCQSDLEIKNAHESIWSNVADFPLDVDLSTDTSTNSPDNATNNTANTSGNQLANMKSADSSNNLPIKSIIIYSSIGLGLFIAILLMYYYYKKHYKNKNKHKLKSVQSHPHKHMKANFFS